MNLVENVKIAVRTLKGNLMRTVLTLGIIAFGIMALMGIITSIEILENLINNNFADLGTNTFEVRKAGSLTKSGKRKVAPPITYQEAARFKEDFKLPAKVSVYRMANFAAALKRKSYKTFPNVQVVSGNENYLAVEGYDLAAGRNFSNQELISGSNKVILGQSILEKLFEDVRDWENNQQLILGKDVSIGAQKYQVVGILEPKGSSSFMNRDNLVIIPLLNGKQKFGSIKSNYNIKVFMEGENSMDQGEEEAIGLLRNIRNLKTADKNDFEITKSEKLKLTENELMTGLIVGATIIGLITLIGSSISLMNILLISVAERTREVGITKALGATRTNILRQFITEAVVIFILGGSLGILLGIACGNIVAVILKSSFVIPWKWTFIALVVCFVTGMVSGIYPAYKASRLDPVEALRYE